MGQEGRRSWQSPGARLGSETERPLTRVTAQHWTSGFLYASGVTQSQMESGSWSQHRKAPGMPCAEPSACPRKRRPAVNGDLQSCWEQVQAEEGSVKRSGQAVWPGGKSLKTRRQVLFLSLTSGQVIYFSNCYYF